MQKSPNSVLRKQASIVGTTTVVLLIINKTMPYDQVHYQKDNGTKHQSSHTFCPKQTRTHPKPKSRSLSSLKEKASGSKFKLYRRHGEPPQKIKVRDFPTQHSQ